MIVVGLSFSTPNRHFAVIDAKKDLAAQGYKRFTGIDFGSALPQRTGANKLSVSKPKVMPPTTRPSIAVRQAPSSHSVKVTPKHGGVYGAPTQPESQLAQFPQAQKQPSTGSVFANNTSASSTSLQPAFPSTQSAFMPTQSTHPVFTPTQPANMSYEIELPKLLEEVGIGMVQYSIQPDATGTGFFGHLNMMGHTFRTSFPIDTPEMAKKVVAEKAYMFASMLAPQEMLPVTGQQNAGHGNGAQVLTKLGDTLLSACQQLPQWYERTELTQWGSPIYACLLHWATCGNPFGNINAGYAEPKLARIAAAREALNWLENDLERKRKNQLAAIASFKPKQPVASGSYSSWNGSVVSAHSLQALNDSTAIDYQSRNASHSSTLFTRGFLSDPVSQAYDPTPQDWRSTATISAKRSARPLLKENEPQGKRIKQEPEDENMQEVRKPARLQHVDGRYGFGP